MNVGNYRVRYRDVYSAGVVLNSRFLDICDEAFTEYFRALGFPPEALYEVPFNGALGHMDATYRSTALPFYTSPASYTLTPSSSRLSSSLYPLALFSLHLHPLSLSSTLSSSFSAL